MYPETDIAPIPIRAEMVEAASKKLPPRWEEQVHHLMTKHGLGEEQADHVLDSEHYVLFEKVVGETELAPTFVASFLTETVVSLGREGLDVADIDENLLEELLLRIGKGDLAKEAAPAVLRAILSKKAKGIAEAVASLNLGAMTSGELSDLVAETIRENPQVIHSKGTESFGLLMGRVMSKARGRVDGAKVSAELKRQLQEAVAKTSK
jgi:glutamyl-tRNA(Gln) amidotransferase subunit E